MTEAKTFTYRGMKWEVLRRSSYPPLAHEGFHTAQGVWARPVGSKGEQKMLFFTDQELEKLSDD